MKNGSLMKPSKNENQHIWEHELKVRQDKLHQEQHEANETEQRFLKRLHWMHCPKCGHQLATEHHGPVEVDVCPACRGVWLDAQELEAVVAAESGVLRSCFRILNRRS